MKLKKYGAKLGGLEKTVQNNIVGVLRKKGYSVIRAGLNGIPDLIAVKLADKGDLWGWANKPLTDGTILNISAVNICSTQRIPGAYLWVREGSFGVLGIECKRVSGGKVHPRQKATLLFYSKFMRVLVATSVQDIVDLIS